MTSMQNDQNTKGSFKLRFRKKLSTVIRRVRGVSGDSAPLALELEDSRRGVFEYNLNSDEARLLIENPEDFENFSEMPADTESIQLLFPFRDFDPEEVIVVESPDESSSNPSYHALTRGEQKTEKPGSLTEVGKKTVKMSWFEIAEEDARVLMANIAETRKEKGLVFLPRGVPPMIKKMFIGQANEDLFQTDREIVWNVMDRNCFDSMQAFNSFCSKCKDENILNGAKAIMKMLMSLNETGILARTTFSVFVAQSWLKGVGAPLPRFTELREYAVGKVAGFTQSVACAELIVKAFTATIRVIEATHPLYYKQRQDEYIQQLEQISLSDQEIINGLLRKETVKVMKTVLEGKKTKTIEEERVVKHFPKIRTDVKVTDKVHSMIKEKNSQINLFVTQGMKHVNPLDRIDLAKKRLETSYREVDKINHFLQNRRKEIILLAKESLAADTEGKLTLPQHFQKVSQTFTCEDSFLEKELSDN